MGAGLSRQREDGSRASSMRDQKDSVADNQ